MKAVQKHKHARKHSRDAHEDNAKAEAKKADACKHSKRKYFIQSKQKECVARLNYMKNKYKLQAARRGRYYMSEPKPSVKHAYIIETQQRLYHNVEERIELMQVYKKCHNQSQTRRRILSREWYTM